MKVQHHSPLALACLHVGLLELLWRWVSFSMVKKPTWNHSMCLLMVRSTEDLSTPKGSIHTQSFEDLPCDNAHWDFLPQHTSSSRGRRHHIRRWRLENLRGDQLKLWAIRKTITFRSKGRYSQPRDNEPTCRSKWDNWSWTRRKRQEHSLSVFLLKYTHNK